MEEENQKLDPVLGLALELRPEERSISPQLEAGFEPDTETWEVIVKYQGNLKQYESPGFCVEELIAGYGIVTLKEERLPFLLGLQEVEYVEMPKPLYENDELGREAACITPVTEGSPFLTGAGVLVAIPDSSIDVSNMHFRKEDGTTRIIELWDQNIQPEQMSSDISPACPMLGRIYTEAEINEMIDDFPVKDISGHGTAVAGILAAGCRDGYCGVAPECSLLIIKLRQNKRAGYSDSGDIMRGVTYALNCARKYNMPLVINLSYGTVSGSHRGNSLLERFLDNASEIGKTTIVVGSGNEGSSGRHASGRLMSGRTEVLEMTVGEYDFGFSVQIFTPGTERIRVSIRSPLGEIYRLPSDSGNYFYTLLQERLYSFVSSPRPYTTYREMFIGIYPEAGFVTPGIWTLILEPVKIVTGEYEIYLSENVSGNEDLRFLLPTPELTVTIPATSEKVISVGAYSVFDNAYAPFSGRGFAGGNNGSGVKPDIVAPGVGIRTVSAGGGYTVVSGTSFAAPFVSGSAALLMEWGILRGYDPFFYGERMKSYLRQGAKTFPGFGVLPNDKVGFGALCLLNSFSDS